MTAPVACEHCGKLVQPRAALVETVDDWPYYFCSEVCKFNWGEQADREMDDDRGRT